MNTEHAADSNNRKRDRDALSSESDRSFSCATPAQKRANDGNVVIEETLAALQKKPNSCSQGTKSNTE